jgi:hypothetical protein
VEAADSKHQYHARSRLPGKFDKHFDVKRVQKVSSNLYRNRDGNGIGHRGTDARLPSCVSIQNPLLKTNKREGNCFPSQNIVYPTQNVWGGSIATQSSFMMEEVINEQNYVSTNNNYMNQMVYNNDNSYGQNSDPLFPNVQLLPI